MSKCIQTVRGIFDVEYHYNLSLSNLSKQLWFQKFSLRTINSDVLYRTYVCVDYLTNYDFKKQIVWRNLRFEAFREISFCQDNQISWEIHGDKFLVQKQISWGIQGEKFLIQSNHDISAAITWQLYDRSVVSLDYG